MHACLCLDCAEESLIVTGFECVMCKMCLASVGLFGTAKTRARAIHVTKRLRRMRSYMQKIIRCTYMWNLMQFLRHVHVGNIANTAFARMARLVPFSSCEARNHSKRIRMSIAVHFRRAFFKIYEAVKSFSQSLFNG